MSTQENFGAFVRRQRKARQMGLRQMAKMVGVSPTYLSMVERGEVPPPAEDKVIAIARTIELDADDLLSRANRLPSDVVDIIKRRPVVWAQLVRGTEDAQARIVFQRVLRFWKTTGPAMSERGMEDEKARRFIERFLVLWEELMPKEKDHLGDEETARADEDCSATHVQ